MAIKLTIRPQKPKNIAIENKIFSFLDKPIKLLLFFKTILNRKYSVKIKISLLTN